MFQTWAAVALHVSVLGLSVVSVPNHRSIMSMRLNASFSGFSGFALASACLIGPVVLMIMLWYIFRHVFSWKRYEQLKDLLFFNYTFSNIF